MTLSICYNVEADFSCLPAAQIMVLIVVVSYCIIPTTAFIKAKERRIHDRDYTYLSTPP